MGKKLTTTSINPKFTGSYEKVYWIATTYCVIGKAYTVVVAFFNQLLFLKTFFHSWCIKGGKACNWDYVQMMKNNLKHIFTKFYQLTSYCFWDFVFQS